MITAKLTNISYVVVYYSPEMVATILRAPP